MIAVKIYWNVEADGTPVPDDTPLEKMPMSVYGPFDSITEAISWIENDYPDGDMDVYEMTADDYDIPRDWVVNDPKSIFGDIPDEDIRDQTEDVPVVPV